MEKSVRLRAFAKTNLSLNITGRDDDTRLHTLDSVMMSVDLFDTVTVRERADEMINVSFVGADIGADNTALKAAELVRDRIGGGWDITVEKGIPIGAGLGGSSADGAAVLRALDLFYDLTERGVDMRAAALAVGSDVPFMLTGGLARVRGVGDDMFFIENKLKAFGVGLMAGEVSTKASYAAFDKMYPSGAFAPTDNDALCSRLLDGNDSALDLVGNALLSPSASLLPQISANVKLLIGLGAKATMTGSGGMAVGWFTDIAAFASCVEKLRGTPNMRVMSPARTGILHEWLSSAK